ncbi:Nif3-like dinuclear metal center hexameric protein [Limisalsivibrio acetivorans]|uniref:Nif3-like dinuclear metal center hexameric protein n=1 Tax=Limisalsivibrio acetivorans TaxID=1304888 RepID=UPI0003B722B9|nr:Nif3-like dinuclear metal center hexameric protein [Limisalsivibrio acetivorans]
MEKSYRHIADYFLKELSSSRRQYEWDNSGYQIFTDGERMITKAGFALDPSERVISKAIEEGCELLVTHHPLFFGKLKSLTPATGAGRKAILALRNGLDIISCHTSMDVADYSLNDYVCSILGAEVKDIFVKEGRDDYCKYAVFVPKGHEQEIIDAVHRGGGGFIGNYSHCTFRVNGTGTFLPGEGTDPFIGKKGELEQADEYRMETIVPVSSLARLIKEVEKAHPYEEVAYDVYKLDMGEEWGLGRVAALSNSMTLGEFMDMTAKELGIKDLRHSMADTDMLIDSFAVVTGSGASMWKACAAKGIKVLLTGDMKHHDALDAAEAGVCIIDAGHYGTERIFMNYLKDKSAEELGIETVLIDEENPIKTRGDRCLM